MPCDDERLNDTAGFIRRQHVNTAALTPSFLSSIEPSDVPTLQTLVVGGEKPSEELVARWASRVKLVLVYGSTETNLVLQTVHSAASSDVTLKPVGCRAWITAPGDASCPLDVATPGELAIESWTLARGYLGGDNAARMATKFVQTPQWLREIRQGAETRLFMTGDMALMLADGRVRVLGRRDDVTKLRGQKVDLGEVDTAIRRSLPPRCRSAVLPSDDSEHLLGFVALNEESGSTHYALPEAHLIRSSVADDLVRTIERDLNATLPAFLIPSRILVMDRFPLTASGKLDRQALLRLSRDAPVGMAGAKRKPRSAQEVAMCQLWSVVLKLPEDQIGLDDDFFQLGGHSLAAIRLVSTARKRDISLQVKLVFEHSTLEALSAQALPVCAMALPATEPMELVSVAGSTNSLAELLDEISSQYPIQKEHIEDIYTCSPLQSGIMALTMKQPGAYAARCILPLETSVDEDRLMEAWCAAHQQCPILRSRIVETNLGTLQVVLREQLEWKRVETDLETFLQRDREQHMTLGSQLSRLTVVHDTVKGRQFVWTVHHAIMDAWAIKALLSLVSDLYSGIQPEPLPNFSTYVRHLKQVDHEAQRQYWCSYLQDCPPPGFPVLTTTLSAYTPQPDASTHKILCLPLKSSSTVTPATVIRAGWALLLGHYSNTEDVVFGATLSGRTIDLPHIDRMLGPTICTVPVRARMDGDMSVSSFLHRVQREAAEMTPFEQVGLQNIRRLGPQLRAACNFQTHLIIQSGEAEEPPNLLGSAARVDDWEASASYAINLEVTVTGTDVACDVLHDPRVVPEEQMDLLLVHFGRLLEKLCAQGDDMMLRDLEMITPMDTDRIFRKNSRLPDPVDACTHDMIREQGQRHPDYEAVCSWDGNLTYGELEEWSNAVAKQLVLDGTASLGDVIPIMTEKSLWAVVAMLAVWKAGCAWTLLDTSHPDAWIKQIVEDGSSRVVVCTEACVNRLPKEQVKKFIMNRRMVDECPDPAEVASWTRSSPHSVAFILYTSGSTGKPKAIPHEHVAFLSGVAARLSIIKRDQASRVLQFSSYAFDTAIEDSITTFLVGGTVCIPSEHERHNDLVGYMNRMRVSHADFTPSFASIMSTDHPPSLRVLTLSGETVTPAHRDTWAHRVTLINSYGPSEVAIISHTGVIGPSSLPSNVGARTGCVDWIVRPDGSDRLQALGCVGELLLEGPILSRGYLNNEAKTRESFITNPQWLPASQFGPRRLYRTGDLARYTADGGVQIIGRKDDSMRKLRGQRIEVSQVEAYVVESLAGLHRDDGGQGVGVTDVLADVVNLAQSDGGGAGNNRIAQSLVVFVSLGDAYSEATDQKLATWCAAIDHHLRNSLPSYMVPTAIVPLERFPLTVHGKTDKKELVLLVEKPGLQTRICYMAPSSGYMQAAQMGALVAVSTLAERRLRDLWAETLGIAPDCLGADSNFVHLGGDSIMAMKMVALANRKGEPGFLTVESVLRNPVLSDMARRAMDTSVTRSRSNVDEGPVAPFQLLDVPADRLASTVERLASMCDDCGSDAVEDVFPCTRLQQGLMALSTKRPGTYVSQQVFELPAWVEVDRFKEAWDTVYASTAILRTRIVQSSAEDALQVIVKEGRIDWAEGCDVDEYLRQDMERPMGQGSRLSRYALLENMGTCHFIWTMHHAIYDGWCISLLLASVSQAYNGAFTRPRAEYSQFVRHLIRNTDQDDNQRFWRQYLDGVTEAAIFPRLPSPAHTVRADASLDYTMSLPAGHRSLGSANVNLTTLLYTAWGMLVSKYLESADVVFGTTRTGRGAPVAGIDEIAGPTFATVPLRMSIEDAVPVAELLCGVQAQFTEMLAYEHFGLHGIKAVSDDAARASSFQTLVVVQPKEEADPGMFANAHVSGDISDFNPYCVMLQLKPCPSHTTVDVNVSFDSAVIDVAQMQRILHQLEHLVHELCRLAQDQAATLADINYLTRQDHAEILAWNNNGVAPEADDRCIHDVITQQAEQYPDEPAICLWDGHTRSDMSYRELDGLSSLLSRDLVRRGVRPETIVPICSEKSFFAVVALLAVLKAGGAFVLLDPAHPLDRLLSVIQQTGAKMMITSESCARLFTSVKEEGEEGDGSGLGLDILSERGWLESPASSGNDTDNWSTAHNNKTQASPSNLACLVFTSGSTGRPKGIQLQHSAVCTSVLRGHGPALNLTRASRVFQFASFAFDMALYDICGTLMMGGCVCMPTEASRLNGLAASIRALDANWAFFTPSTVTLLSPDEVPCLRDLTVGGEAVKQETVDVWAGRVNLFQCSGPAETTTCVTQAMQPTTSRSRLGKGAGVLCWVVSTQDHNVLAPIGTVGELIVEGATVARGYLADEHNALGLFIPTPRWARIAASDAVDVGAERRFYRCGDLVRYDSEGGLNFVGRKDTQIKVRGQRIELAEVEECIKEETRSDVVAEVIVPLSRGDSDGERSAMLVVLISIGQEAAAAAESLTSSPSSPSPPSTTCSVISQPPDAFYAEISRLQGRATACLPPYMVPSFYIPVSCIPLNSSGKVDRKMLKTLGSQLSAKDLAIFSSPEQRVVPVETPAEMLMQELWAQVLKVEAGTIGANSNLLHMGGDSISAMQLVALATSRGLRLTVADIFRNPELRSLCRSVVSLLDAPGPWEAQHEPFDLLRSSASAGGRDNDSNNDDDNTVRRGIAKSLGVDEDAVEDAYPCTPLQEGLMLSSVQSSGGAYIAREVYALPSGVDIERFKMACEAVYQSHYVLRSCIAQSESLGCINVVLRGPLHWHHGDDIDDYLQKDGRDPIQFGEILTRWAIVGSGPSSSSVFFVWTRHHSAYDGYSLQAALEDIGAAYNAKTTMPVAPEPKTSFRDFVQYLAGRDTAADIAYWERALGSTSQPAAVWRSPNQALTPEMVQTAELQVALPPLTGSNITVSTCIRAAWALMLQRYSGSDSIIFGETLSGRNVPVPGVDHCPGPTFTTVPVCIAMDRDLAVGCFLQEIQDQFVEMIAHQHYGLQNIMKINADLREACHYDSLLIIQPEAVEHEDDSFLRPVRLGGDSSFFTNALTLICRASAEGIQASLHYDKSQLGNKQAPRLLAQFAHVLQQLASRACSLGPALPLCEIEYMSTSDLLEVMQWNQKPPPPTVTEDCIHDVITRTANKSPDAVAIDAWDGTYTYADLDRTASCLAEHLARLGVSKGTLVPLIFPKSCWFIISIVAVLKAGGAFVGISHEDPRERIDSILSSCASSLVLVSPECAHLAAPTGAISLTVTKELVASLTKETQRRAGEDTTGRSTAAGPSDLCCVVFTSGSTGIPKGIMLEHSLVCTNAVVHAPALSISASTRTLHFSNHCWDALFIEVMYPLMHGGCVCVPPDQARMNGLAGVLNATRANWMFATPTTASLVSPEDVPCLETLVMGGEAAPEHVLVTWQAFRGNLHNIYGPAECGVFCVTNRNHKQAARPSELGRRITGRLWLCDPDDHNRLAPIGCVGELLVEGPVLARGYLNQPDKTAESFLETTSWLDRVGRASGVECAARLYRTGDLLRYGDDGTLEFVGRRDFQFKVNGQRVDAADVEQHITAHLGTAGGPVVVDKVSLPGGATKAVLAAFIDVSGGSGGGDADREDKDLRRNLNMDEDLRQRFNHLQEALSAELPRFMVPTLYVPMGGMPLTATGKLDRRALWSLCADLQGSQLDSYRLLRQEKEPPVGTAEVRLQRLWSRVLDTTAESIGRHDSFLNLGGDSIAAMRLVTLARREGLSLDVGSVFHKPRLLDMAMALDSSKKASPGEDRAAPYKPFSLVKGDCVSTKSRIASLIPYRATNIADVYPATSFQALSVASGLLQCRGMWGYFSFDGVGELDLDHLKESCSRLVHAHEVLRTIFVRDRGNILQVVLDRIHFRFEVFQTSQADLAAQSRRVISQDMSRPIRLGDTFVAFFLVQSRSSNLFRLIVRMNHAQYDSLSLPGLWKTLADAYRQDLSASPIPSPTPPSPTAYSLYMREYAAQRSDPRSRNYWRNLLRGAAVTQLTTRSSPRYRRCNSSSNAVVTVARHATIHTMGLVGGITPATVVKAAWAMVLRELMPSQPEAADKDNDIVFLTTVSGRATSTSSGRDGDVVGACLNVVPVRVHLANDSACTGVTLMRRIQDQNTAGLEFGLPGLDAMFDQGSASRDGSGGTSLGWTYQGSLVQHDGDISDPMTAEVADGSGGIRLGEAVLRPAESMGNPGDFADVAIHSSLTPYAADEGVIGPSSTRMLLVQVTALAPEIDGALAVYMAERICFHAEHLTAYPDEPVWHRMGAGLTMQEDKKWRLPLLEAPLPPPPGSATLPPPGQSRTSSSGDSPSPPLTPTEQDGHLVKMLEHIWAEVLGGAGGADASAAVDLGRSFFDQGADMVKVCCLADALRTEGYDVSMDALIYRQYFYEQLSLLSVM